MKWLAAASCLLASLAGAAELTREQAHYVYMMAHAESGLPLPAQAPEIRVVPESRLQELICPGQNCRMVGAEVGGIIYIRDDVDFSQPRALLILAHEAVHYMQNKARGGGAKSCEEWMERERQAFAVEMRLAQKANLETLSIMGAMNQLRCR